MNKEEKREKAFLYAYGAMTDDESKLFEEKVREDRELQEESYAWQKVNEQAILDLEEEELPFQSYASIMGRINEEEAKTAPSNGGRGNLVSFISWSGWAVAACAALVFALNLDNSSPVSEDAPRFIVDASSNDIVLNDLGKPGRASTVAVSNVENGLEDRMMEVAELAEAYWFSREGMSAEEEEGLASSERWSDGFTIFDRKYKIGFIGVENMPESQVGKFYNVWARNASGGDAIWAGRLPMGDASRGLFYFDLSRNEELSLIHI